MSIIIGSVDLIRTETGPLVYLVVIRYIRDKDMGGYRYRDVYDFNPLSSFF